MKKYIMLILILVLVWFLGGYYAIEINGSLRAFLLWLFLCCLPFGWTIGFCVAKIICSR